MAKTAEMVRALREAQYDHVGSLETCERLLKRGLHEARRTFGDARQVDGGGCPAALTLPLCEYINFC